jgi:hypothetical protein
MRTRRFLPAVNVVIATVVAATAGTRWPAVAADVETPAGERTAAAAFRLPPRPERSADERSRLAAELRAIYAGDAAGWPSGRYVLSIAAEGITNAAGTTILDGDWITGESTFAAGSGDGEAGGTFNFFFNALVGDVNGNGSMNPTDISAIRSNLTSPFTTPLQSDSSNYRLDINGSNGLNSADLSQTRAQLTSAFGTSLASLPPVTAPTERSVQSFAVLADSSENTLSIGLSVNAWAWYGIEAASGTDGKGKRHAVR